MFQGAKSPMQDLADEQNPMARNVHHTGPGGPREKASADLNEVRGMYDKVNPQGKGAAGLRGSIVSEYKNIAKQIQDMDITHILKAKGYDENTIQEMMSTLQKGQMNRADPDTFQGIGETLAEKGVGTTPTQNGGSSMEQDMLQQDIRNKRQGQSPIR